MNKMSLEEVNKVVPILLTNNVELKEVFDYFRIVSLNHKEPDQSSANILYFLPYNTQEEVDKGWFISRFDLRDTVNERMKKNPNCTFVIEPWMIDKIKDKRYKFIVVENISDAIERLYEYTKSKSTAKVISVTGSVGKTTTVGLIESVLKEKYNTLRIYSKRITPIILKAHIINFLNENIDFIILENSIYYHDHVKTLCQLLPPTVACMLNIKTSHLGIDKLKTLDDICIYKSEILRNAKFAIINSEDEFLANIRLNYNGLEYKGKHLFETTLEYLDSIHPSKSVINGNDLIIFNSVRITPFIHSNLSKIQYSMAAEIGVLFGLTKEEIEKGMNSYQPVENRLNKKNAFGREIIFDGDITTYERMKELSDLNYENTYLIIRKVGSKENYDRIINIEEFFDHFAKVYIFEDIEYFNEFKNHKNVETVSDHNFIKNLDGTIIYHYSGYYRVWDTFEETNLNIYDKTIYPIKRPTSQSKKLEIK